MGDCCSREDRGISKPGDVRHERLVSEDNSITKSEVVVVNSDSKNDGAAAAAVQNEEERLETPSPLRVHEEEEEEVEEAAEGEAGSRSPPKHQRSMSDVGARGPEQIEADEKDNDDDEPQAQMSGSDIGTVRHVESGDSMGGGGTVRVTGTMRKSSSEAGEAGKKETKILPWQRKDYKMKGETAKLAANRKGKHRHMGSHPTMRELESLFKEHATSVSASSTPTAVSSPTSPSNTGLNAI